MKNLFLLLVLNIIILTSAQIKIDNLQIDYGSEILDDQGDIVKIINEKNNTIYTLALKGEDQFFIKTFTSDLIEKSKTKIKLPEYKDKDLIFEDVFMINNNLYVLGSTYTQKTKTFNLVGFKLNEDGTMDNKGIILFESQVEKRALKGDFYFKQNPSETNLLILHTSLLNKKDAIQYEVKLFDENMNSLMENKKIVYFDDDKRKLIFNLADFATNDKNDVFVVINESFYDKYADNTIQNLFVDLYKSKNKYQEEKITINFQGKKVTDCSILATHNDYLQLTGFYSPLNKKGKGMMAIEGIYMAPIDIRNNQSNNVIFNEFDMATKIKLIGEKRAKKGKDLLPYYSNIYTIEKEDGGLIILSEYSLMMQGGGAGIGIGPVGVSMNSLNIYKNEIIVTSLNPDGSYAWSNVLPKDQDASIKTIGLTVGGMVLTGGSFVVGSGFYIPYTILNRGPEYMSVLPLYENKELKLIFNDGDKNKGKTNIDNVANWGNYNKTSPSIFVFDDKGNMKRIDSEKISENQLVLRPMIVYRVDNKNLIVYGSRKSKNSLGRLKVSN